MSKKKKKITVTNHEHVNTNSTVTEDEHVNTPS